METDQRVETLEDEFKLIKGQLKETLASVRDYLLTMELPASEYQTIMAALGVSGGGGGAPMTMKGEITAPKQEAIPKQPMAETEEPSAEQELVEEEEPAEEELVERDEPREELLERDEPREELLERDEPSEEELLERDEPSLAESELPREELEQGEPFAPESELPEQQMEHGKTGDEVSQSVPPVNLMANLIRWVANAKREIGGEQLAIFLEVYGISGHLYPELKEVILRLADISSDQSAEPNTAEIWSRLISELHGILTGGDAPLHPVRPFWNDGGGAIEPSETEAEENRSEDKPLKLKLVFSNGEGTDKEFCINLNQEENKDSP